MTPVNDYVFVEKIAAKEQDKQNFTVVQKASYNYRIVSSASKDFQPGWNILFTDCRTYNYNGQEIIAVKTDDIVGVEHV